MTKRLAAGTMWRHFLLSGAAFAVASAWPSAAFAHATLVRSEPADRAVLASAPRELRFVFSEPVRVTAGNEAIRNGGGRVLAGAARITGGSTLVLPLRRLGDGDYSARWSVVSDDGHREQGVIAFAVGAGRAPPVPELTASASLRTEDVVSRALFLLGTLISAGALLQLRDERARTGLVVGAFGLAFLGASSLLHTADAAGTRFARMMEVGSTAALVGGAAAALVPWYPRLRWLAWTAAAALLAVPTLSGHALDTGRPRPLAAALDLAHVAAAAVWLGGLAALAVSVPRERTAEAARRFSPFALGSVLVLAATGAGRAVIELDSVSEAWSTGYGRAILVKTSLFVVLIALGWLNRYRLLPALDAAGERLALLRDSVRAEVGLLAGVVVAAAVLTALRPAGQPAVASPSTVATPPPLPPAGRLQLGRQDRDLAVGLSYAPGRLTATMLAQDGTAPDVGLALDVDGRAVPTASCGAGCFAATVGAARTIRIRPDGYPSVSFRIPTAVEPGGALLGRAEGAFRRLRTVTIDESLSSGPGLDQRSRQRMAAPNRFSYELADGSAGIVIGERRWDRIGRGAWHRSLQTPPLSVPTTLWSRARRDARLIGPDRIAFLDPSLPAWFDVTLDPRTDVPTRVRMIAAAHFMTERYSRFDRPVRISPPG